VRTTCSSCGAPIIFKQTVTGKQMPLDAEPNADGNVQLGWIGGEEVALLLAEPGDRAAAQIAGHLLYMPHFATCPNADEHRRPINAP